MEDPGRAVDAEPALAGAHAEPQRPPHVVEIRRAAAAHRLLELAAPDQLALADQLLVEQCRLAPAQPRAERVELRVLVVRRAHGVGRARPLVAELLAHRVDDVLGHHPVRRQLAADIVRKRSTPSRSEWSTTAWVRLTSRVSAALSDAFSSW